MMWYDSLLLAMSVVFICAGVHFIGTSWDRTGFWLGVVIVVSSTIGLISTIERVLS